MKGIEHESRWVGESLPAQTTKALEHFRVSLLLIAVLSSSLVLGAACGATGEGNGLGTDSSSEAPPAPDPGVVHVHGLGVNPKDGALFAATHTGLFRIVEGKAERVSDRYQDTMGFTVVGPDHFLGSGHPDVRDYVAGKLPGLLGLVESTDAGQSWKPQSLLGKVDFHVLAFAHGRIYGFDSTGGRFMLSNDGKKWAEKAQLSLLSFAVSPRQSEFILGTTERGLQMTKNGGDSWGPVNGPSLVLLSWPEDSRLFGVDSKGNVYQSDDGSQTWKQKGVLAGPPEAFLATTRQLYAAVSEKGIYVSTDDGVSWSTFYQN